MVYCDLKQKNGKTAVYLFGLTTDNITGEVEFSSNLSKPVILKQPNRENVGIALLSKVVAKYRREFSSGKFPQKASYEI